MADPFIAEIRIFPFNFAPKGWAFCNGQILPISQNTALFSLLGTTYGGDGKTTFRLPDLQGRAALGPGQGPGLSSYQLGETGGTETVTLVADQMTSHNHALLASTAAADEEGVKAPAGKAPGVPQASAQFFGALSGNVAAMASQTLSLAGGNLPHTNLQPYLTLNFCIALQGVFPPRS